MNNREEKVLEREEPPLKIGAHFKHEAWHRGDVFTHLKDNYLRAYAVWTQAVEQLPINAKQKQALQFLTKQTLAFLHPQNYLFTNPQALDEALKTNGHSVLKGVENLAQSIESGKLDLKMVDKTAFTKGVNIAATPGKVVFKNELLELLHYTPTEPAVHATPLLIVPPFINKYYVFDLAPENSFVKWLVGQGLDVYIIKWVNPDASLQGYGFEQYMVRGVQEAHEQVLRHSQQQTVNMLGYCIGGTLAASYAAYAQQTKPGHINTLTLLATLIDYSEPGEMGCLLGTIFTEAQKQKAKAQGVVAGEDVNAAFNLLKPYEQFYSNMTRQFLLGKPPLGVDLLYWNADNPNLPYTLWQFLVNDLYGKNVLAKPGARLNNVPLRFSELRLPLYFVAAEEDHITLPRAIYKSAQLFENAPKEFLLVGSGHVAGMMNSPHKNKYHHYPCDGFPPRYEALLNEKPQKGSWWPVWGRWLKARSGEKINPKRSTC